MSCTRYHNKRTKHNNGKKKIIKKVETFYYIIIERHKIVKLLHFDEQNDKIMESRDVELLNISWL